MKRKKGSTKKAASPAKRKNSTPQIDPEKASFRLECRRSKIHRWGVFTLEPIPARRRVIEYTGERIDQAEMDRRSGKKLLYLFSVSPNRIIDGAVDGSGAQYINHSCDGNMKSYSVNGHIYLSSVRPIEPDEELTYDYNIDEEFDVPCVCGAENCRGKLGAQ